MKEELRTILPYLEHEENEILILRNSILELDASQPDALESKVEYLIDLINEAGFKNHDLLGYYYLFLGCIFYEMEEYDNVILNLQRANPELWDSQINKALTHWLLGISYSHMNIYPKAQGELKDAINLLWGNTHANTSQVEEQHQLESRIQKRINQALINLDNRSAHYVALPSRNQETQKSPNFMEKIKRTFIPPNTSLPEQTSYEQPLEKKSEVAKSKPTFSTKPHIVHITIPVDVNALDNIPCDSACVTPDLVKKIQDFNESRK